MKAIERSIKITGKLGFIHEVLLKFHPTLGFANAYYDGQIIADMSYGKINPPYGDDDAEWERYSELVEEWCDEVQSNLSLSCSIYFNK